MEPTTHNAYLRQEVPNGQGRIRSGPFSLSENTRWDSVHPNQTEKKAGLLTAVSGMVRAFRSEAFVSDGLQQRKLVVRDCNLSIQIIKHSIGCPSCALFWGIWSEHRAWPQPCMQYPHDQSRLFCQSGFLPETLADPHGTCGMTQYERDHRNSSIVPSIHLYSLILF